jgi:hypothetical protein
MNKFRSKPTEQAQNPVVENNVDSTINKISEFTFFIKKEQLNDIIPALLLLVFTTILYVSLSHFHVKSLKNEDELKKEINELRSEYISVKSNLMKKSNPSEVSKRLETEGLKELTTPPIILKKD